MLALAVPFALLVRDDWRDQLVALTPSLPWPKWMRTEAVRLDRLSLEERRRARVEQWQRDDREAELLRLERAVKGLQAVEAEAEEWGRRQETAEQRERRTREETERADLEERIASMEEKVRAFTQRQAEAVKREVEDSERRLQSSYLTQAAKRGAEWTRALEQQLQATLTGVKREAESELDGRLTEEVQQARESEGAKGVERITSRAMAEQSALEDFTQRLLSSEEQRLRSYHRVEAERIERLMEWAKEEERAMQVEFDELSDLHFLSTNIHRLNVLLLAVDSALHSLDSTPSSPPSLTQPWAQLKAVARADPLISAAAESVPPSLLSSPPPSFDALQLAFGELEGAALTALYSPPPSTSPSLFSHLLAHLFSLLTVPHAALLPATDDWARLSRVRWLLYEDAEKDIGRVVGEVEAMEGAEVREVLTDWLTLAKERAIIEQAVKLIKTRVEALELGVVGIGDAEAKTPQPQGH